MITVPDAVTPMMTGTIGFVVQSFLATRASRVGRTTSPVPRAPWPDWAGPGPLGRVARWLADRLSFFDRLQLFGRQRVWRAVYLGSLAVVML